MGQITDALLHLHGPVIYAVVAALVFAEAALFFRFGGPEVCDRLQGIPEGSGPRF